MNNFLQMFCGDDGKLSGKRVIGAMFALVGMFLFIVGQYQVGTSWLEKIIPGLAASLVSTIFWGLVTAQNAVAIYGAMKGNITLPTTETKDA